MVSQKNCTYSQSKILSHGLFNGGHLGFVVYGWQIYNFWTMHRRKMCDPIFSIQLADDKTFGSINLRIKHVFIDTITYFLPKKGNRAILERKQIYLMLADLFLMRLILVIHPPNWPTSIVWCEGTGCPILLIQFVGISLNLDVLHFVAANRYHSNFRLCLKQDLDLICFAVSQLIG